MIGGVERPLGRVRVILVAPPLEIVGGQSVQGERLRRALERRSDVELIFRPWPPDVPRALQPLQRPPLLRTAFNAAAFQAKLAPVLGSADILHLFTSSYWGFMWAPAPSLAIARLVGRKSVLNYRDGRAEGHLREWRSAKPLIGLADAVVSPSHYLVDVFGEHGLRARSIPNIIESQNFPHRGRGRLQPRFLHNRGLEPLYNVPCTLRAFGLVQRRFPAASLVVAHDGPCRPRLGKMVGELGLKNVSFVGQVPQRRMHELLDEADIYWMSPNLDCMPGSILEAYACGLPVISTKAGGVSYIVRDGETGLLAELDNHEAMAAAAIRLLTEEGLAERLTENARRELAKYDADQVAQQWVDLYRELLGRGSDRSAGE